MDILNIIEKKRLNQILNEAEIRFFINEYTKNKTIPDYQAAAFLMACAINGLNSDETFFLTNAMLHSGNTVNLKSISGIKIDKHSTGGVGDKVSLILTPICVALGLKVAKLSGKGLGHTGGTIDKLESIGVNCNLQSTQALKLLEKVGAYIMAQTTDIVPADKMIYNLRNATSTVQSLPLIAASIVSKKLALCTDYVFLDVKVGDGGFCPTLACAKELATIMLNMFKRFKRKAIIHITNMQQPLGRAIGNAIEIKASIDFLNDHPENQEIKDLIYDFACDILLTVKKAKTRKEALVKVNEVITNGTALKCFYEWIKAQGGNIALIKSRKYFNPTYTREIKAKRAGYINYQSAKSVGMTSFYLGAGRLRKTDSVDYQAGIFLNKTRNEYAHKNETIATLYSSKPITSVSINHFIANVEINPHPCKTEPIIMAVIK